MIVSSVARWFFEETLPVDDRIQYMVLRTDVGVVQDTSISINFEKTLEELEKHWGSINNKIDYLVFELGKCFNGYLSAINFIYRLLTIHQAPE